MTDAAVIDASAPSAPRRKKGRGFGVASFVLAVLVLISYEAFIATVAVLIVVVPGWLFLMVELTQTTGLPFVILTGGPRLVMFGVMGLAGLLFSVGVFTYFAATVTSVLSIAFAIVALVRRARPVFAVTGIVMSILMLAVNLTLFLLSTPWWGPSAG